MESITFGKPYSNDNEILLIDVAQLLKNYINRVEYNFVFQSNCLEIKNYEQFMKNSDVLIKLILLLEKYSKNPEKLNEIFERCLKM